MSTKEQIVEFMRELAYNPMLEEELADNFKLSKKERKSFASLLDEMEAEGLIIKTRKKRFGVPERMGLVVGRLQANAKGFGFIIPDQADIKDVFIPANSMNGAMHNDRVIARINSINSNTKKSEGEIIRILEHANLEIVGTYEDSRNFGFVVPDDPRINVDIYIPKKESKKVNSGYKVVCQITRWPEARRNPEGVIAEVLGHSEDSETNILAIMKKHKLEPEFPEEVEKEVAAIPDEIPQEEIERRADLRNIKMVTIDGADAKDLDDAISIEKLENGNYRLGVHIADVTHYVRENTVLDKEALRRGTSVYLVDRVIPMLPKKLSNGVCSLNPNINRLTLTVFMEIDKKGKVHKHEVTESVININERMIYEDVSDILENDNSELKERYSHLIDDFKMMEDLSKILRKRREERGAIDFDFPEAKVILDDTGKPIEVKKYDRRIANRMIEEFMLVCNETVAEYFQWLNVPFVYRVHEDPSVERLEEFNKFIHNFGYHLKGLTTEVHPKVLQELLKKIEGKKEEVVINTLMLRSLKKARYTSENLGHFGLAAEYYCHFTSPIRRYPDLAIHRIIKAVLQKGTADKWLEKMNGFVGYIGEQSSICERKADEAERDTVDLKKCEYMAERINEEYEGVISGIISFGVFVELDNTIEGMVRVSSLVDDYYIFNSEHHTLTGERTKRVFKIGDIVKIKVSKVNVMQREIDFTLVENKS
ncbi:ribonuclease R [Alkaliphilus peptidifermentans]|uniref:Ribonuclease R n=1 Tax=Alkaliphilus peptidifermentans DSM 18978 TaxID=1120976 RepID=A0A1G5KT28_9FIRM|nr:ribonuclease R [Alkaliphilus peptidifermentans]SCZ03766.1 RNAse R [Alkaliphilus peptidifermentans DSM 18978]